MGLNKKRIGKDLSISWTIKTNGAAVSLSGRDLSLELRNPRGAVSSIDFTTSTNVLSFVLRGTTQELLGKYVLTLWENKGKNGQTAVDTEAFFLVSRTYEEENGTSTNLTVSDIALSGNIETGVPGRDAYIVSQAYDSNGNTLLTWNDGTITTINKGAKGDKGDTGDKGDNATIVSQGYDAYGNAIVTWNDGTKTTIKKGDSVYVTNYRYDADNNTIITFSDGSVVTVMRGKPGKDATVTKNSVIEALGFTPISQSDLNSYHDSTKQNIIADLDTIRSNASSALSKANEAEEIAKGRATGYVFDTKAAMDTWLANPENVAKLVLGDNLYIRAVDTPDYWWDGASAKELETQKVDLTEYAKKSELPTVPTKVSAFENDANYLTQHQDISGKADKSTTYTKTEVDTALAAKADESELTTLGAQVSTHTGNTTVHITADERTSWNGKWAYNENTIKGVKVNNAVDADKLGGVDANEVLSKLYALENDYTAIVMEESSNPAWTRKGNLSAIDRVINLYGSWVFDEERKIRARLSPSDHAYFTDGTEWDGTTGNAFRNFGKLHYVVKQEDGKSVVYGSDKHLGGYAFAENWIGCYKGHVDANGKLRSIPNVRCMGGKTMSAFWDAAQLNGTSYGLMDYFDHCKMLLMHYLKFGTADSSTTMGKGLQDAGYDASYYQPTTGYCHAIGDGTGEATYMSTAHKMNCLFGVEGLSGCQWEFRPNIRFDGVKSIVYEGNIVSNIASGREFNRDANTNLSGAYITKMALGEYFDMIPTVGGGGATTYYCDGTWSAAGGQLLLVGGASYSGSVCGLSAAGSDDGFSTSNAAFGARLAFKGDASEYTEVSGANFMSND